VRFFVEHLELGAKPFSRGGCFEKLLLDCDRNLKRVRDDVGRGSRIAWQIDRFKLAAGHCKQCSQIIFEPFDRGFAEPACGIRWPVDLFQERDLGSLERGCSEHSLDLETARALPDDKETSGGQLRDLAYDRCSPYVDGVKIFTHFITLAVE